MTDGCRRSYNGVHHLGLGKDSAQLNEDQKKQQLK